MKVQKIIITAITAFLAVSGLSAVTKADAATKVQADAMAQIQSNAMTQNQSNAMTQSSDVSVLMPPSVPEYVIFAGDTIDLTRADLRERMDRELIAFNFTHSTSVLMIKRANKIFPQVEPILKECGLPDDLKYLMTIESNLDPEAKSTAGACGLWQFMEASGRQYGLEVNDNIDERYNIEKATRAACKYLLEAYEKYGDWMTVAASYNAGQAGITRKLESQQVASGLDLVLVNETSRYMFRLLTCKMFFENPQAFGFKFVAQDLYPYIPPKKVVTVTETVPDLVKFAKDNGVTYLQLKQENLWLRDSSLKDASHRTYKVAIPDADAQHYDPAKTKVHNSAWIR